MRYISEKLQCDFTPKSKCVCNPDPESGICLNCGKHETLHDGESRKKTVWRAVFLAFIAAYIGWWSIGAVKESIALIERNTIHKKAQAGNVREQIRLAQIYEIGKFINKSKKDAIYWYKRAANNGSLMAKEILSQEYGIKCKQ